MYSFVSIVDFHSPKIFQNILHQVVKDEIQEKITKKWVPRTILNGERIDFASNSSIQTSIFMWDN